jgi:hypothetical protein
MEGRRIQKLLGNLAAAHTAGAVPLDGRHTYLGAEYLQMVVVAYLEGRRKMAAG